jgi:hypothetical protein
MPLDKPTNAGGHARLLLKHLFLKVRDTRKRVPIAEYRGLQIGLSEVQLLSALRQLLRDGSIGMDAAERSIYLTPNGVHVGDSLQWRQPEILVNDPLPESLLDVRTEQRHFAQERSRTMPATPEWEWIKGRLDDLRHLENSMKEQAGSTVYIQSGPGGRLNVNSTDNSVNVVSISEGDVFPRLRQEIETSVIDHVKRKEIVAKLDELEQSKGTPGYASKFREFIAVSADIMTIIGPFIQPLTALIK